ncbi:porin family protein [Parapedobacter sp. 2B3]|uniref:porin family protein n=1 Tax=Parapedobacter sp. 2B3 TaxID=3342381 RepID=UPI0035B65CCC
MKRQLYVAMLGIICCLPSAFAQQEFGVKVGANLNLNKTYEAYDSFSRRTTTVGPRTVTRFMGGIYGSFKIANRWYMQPELLYSQQYHRIENSGEADGGYWRSVRSGQVDYLSIPVFLQYEAMEGLKIGAGPLLGFPIYTPEAIDGGPNILEYMRVLDIGATAAIGYQIPGVGIGIFARYSEGLSNVAKKEKGHDKNRFFSFGLSYAVSKLF